RKAAEQGNALAQFSLGFMYFSGHGVRRDDAAAVRWYRMAADQGNANAQYYLGVIYRDEQSVPQEYDSAYMWSNLAAAIGNQDAAQERDIAAAKKTLVQQAAPLADFSSLVSIFCLLAVFGVALFFLVTKKGSAYQQEQHPQERVRPK